MPIVANGTSAIVNTHLNDLRKLRPSVNERFLYVLIGVLFASRKLVLMNWRSVGITGKTLTSAPVSLRKLMTIVGSRLSNRRPLLIMLIKVTVILYGF